MNRSRVKTIVPITFLIVFFIAFLFYPICYVIKGAFVSEGKLTFAFLRSFFADAAQREGLVNSLLLALTTTVMTSVLSLPLAFASVKYRFPGKTLLTSLLLVPLIMPPFVGAIGMKQFFARFGSVNLMLMKLGIIGSPIDWFGGMGFWGVVILEVLHLYPIMYLNVSAALANVDPSLEEAARNMGSSGFNLFRRVTFPLMLPGYFAGAIIVSIWAFTDLGTPLIFGYRTVIPVQIFEKLNEIGENPQGYVLVVIVLFITTAAFCVSKLFVRGMRFEMMAKGTVASAERDTSKPGLCFIYLFFLGVIAAALIPHLGVLMTSLKKTWFMTILPTEITYEHYRGVLTHELTLPSIKNSIFYSTLSTFIDVCLGVWIAYLLARKKTVGAAMLDAIAMLPLALPGIVLAFGYVGTFSGFDETLRSALSNLLSMDIKPFHLFDPKNNPVLLLVISYSVRRLPYMVRAAYAGLQQTSVSLEEASMNVGASPARTLLKITIPLIMANLIAGAMLSFSFAMLEVSDSLILAFDEKFFPITKAIYSLFERIADGPYIASAMGIWAMLLLALSIMTAGLFLGKRMGELFRA